MFNDRVCSRFHKGVEILRRDVYAGHKRRAVDFRGGNERIENGFLLVTVLDKENGKQN